MDVEDYNTIREIIAMISLLARLTHAKTHDSNYSIVKLERRFLSAKRLLVTIILSYRLGLLYLVL